MKAAVEQNAIVTLPAEKTIADGIAVRAAGVHTLPLVRKYVDEIVTVDDEEIANAILLLLGKGKDADRRRRSRRRRGGAESQNRAGRKKSRRADLRGKY